MERAMNRGAFEAHNDDELMLVDGGGVAENLIEVAGVFVGTMAIAWSPAVACVCPPAAAGMILGGLAIIGKATGAY